MTGTLIEINAKIDDQEVKALLRRIQRNLGDLTPAHKIIGATVRTSVIRNFEKGGRPRKWAPHSKTTEARRGRGAKVLMKQGLGGGMAGSVNFRASRNSVAIGTNKKYAAVHQFGAKKGSFGTVTANIRAHLRKGVKVGAHTRKMKLPWGDIPARPFLMVQDEDWSEIRAALSDYILRSQK